MRITGQSPSECPVCRGIGYTSDTAAEMHTRWSEEHQLTTEYCTAYNNGVAQVGSGCPRCGGTGRL